MSNRADDHLLILNVLHAYTFAIDGKNVEGVRNSFHPDAKIIAFGNEFSVDDYCKGIPNIIEKMTTVHKISNEVVDVDGDRATASSYVLAYHSVPANLNDPGADAIFGKVDRDTDSLILGRYDDILERRGGAWRITRKTIKLTWQQHLPTLPPFPGWAAM